MELTALPPGFATVRDALQRAALTLGTVNLDPLPMGVGADGYRIESDSDAGRALGAIYAWAFELLAALPEASALGDLDPSPVRLWPEHFDVSIELGDETAGRRAGYGVSPGDAEQPEPYVYVTPWTAAPDGPLWNATGFRGADLTWREMQDGADPLDFLLERLHALHTDATPRPVA